MQGWISLVSGGRLGDRIAALDEQRFAGRATLLQRLDRLFSGEPTTPSVVWVHGPGGIGKSALLREVARRAGRAGRAVVLVDGRELEPVPEALAEAISPAQDLPRPVVLLDAFERLHPLAAPLRDDVLPQVPSNAVVVIASRVHPDPGWFRDGWEHVVTVLRVGPLDHEESRDLLDRHGVGDPDLADAMVAWAEGSPLALVSAADAVRTAEPAEVLDATLNRLIVHRLDATAVSEVHPDVLTTTAIARGVDRALLNAVLPHRDPVEDLASLEKLSVIERVGSRLMLHDLVRKALLDDVRARDPGRHATLVTRVADHLAERVDDEPHLLFDLAALVDDADVRLAAGAESSAVHYADRPRPGDDDALASALDVQGEPWWSGVRRWFEEAPDHVVVVRGVDARPVAVALVATPSYRPAFADEDVVLARWLDHARAHVPDGNAMLMRDAWVVGGMASPNAPAAVVGNAAAIVRIGLPNPRQMYAAGRPDIVPFLEALGYHHVAELDVADHGRKVSGYYCDHGPGGVVATMRALVYRDHGVVPGLPRSTDVVRDALRSFHDPVALAASPLASGADVTARSESARGLLATAVHDAFGSTADERELCRLLNRAYLDPEGGHVRAASEANMSRSTYFRRLREATDRVAAFLS